MEYADLDDLFKASKESREYFLSLPVTMQATLSEYSKLIHTQSLLKSAVTYAQVHNQDAPVTESLQHFFDKIAP